MLLLHHPVDLDTCVGADGGTGRAAYTFFRIGGVGIMIAAVIYLLRLQQEYIGRARHHTQIASFAAIGVDCDCSVNFCHIFQSLRLLFRFTRRF